LKDRSGASKRPGVADAKRAVVLLSGGMDSSVVCLYLRERGYHILPHFIFYGQRAADSEWRAARNVAARLELEQPISTDLTSLGDDLQCTLLQGAAYEDHAPFADRFRRSFLPHRNLLFATCAAMQAAARGIDSVAMGIVGGGEPAYPDTTPDFVRKLQRMLRLSADVRVLAPFAAKTKFDVAKFAWDREFDYGATYSCHVQSKIHCGRCPGCIDRDRACGEYPPATPTRYEVPVQWVFA
jgi:7-cyano-7-deazaguanine synthase